MYHTLKTNGIHISAPKLTLSDYFDVSLLYSRVEDKQLIAVIVSKETGKVVDELECDGNLLNEMLDYGEK